MGMPEEAIPQAVITLGWPAEKPEMPEKSRSFQTFFLDRWGSKKTIAASSIGWWSARTKKYAQQSQKSLSKLADKLSKKVKKKLR